LKTTLFNARISWLATLIALLFCWPTAPLCMGQSSGEGAGQNPMVNPSSLPAPTSLSAPSATSQIKSYGQITVPEIFPGILEGYLQREDLPNSLALVPPAPTPGTAAYELDEAVSQAELTLLGSQRWDLAKIDADLTFPQVAGTFSCSLGVPVSEADTPHVYMLLRRSLTDAGLSTYSAKDHYKRSRPFVANKQSTCTPQQEARLIKDGSYPSGHATVGWAWALILTEIAPERADAVLARGRAFGESRLICNAHWQSDVSEGRVVGAGTVARLHADASFRADLDAAKTEYAVAFAKGLKPSRDCAAEASALAIRPTADAKPTVH
jgi:acid phosphatase (class A)